MVAHSSASGVASEIEISEVLGVLEEVQVTGVALDSRALEAGFAFVALQGANGHGLAFLAQAESRGAAAVLVDQADMYASELLANEESSIPVVPVAELREKLGAIARAVYGDVGADLSLVGVTVLGTVGNGFLDKLKTSTEMSSITPLQKRVCLTRALRVVL